MHWDSPCIVQWKSSHFLDARHVRHGWWLCSTRQSTEPRGQRTGLLPGAFWRCLDLSGRWQKANDGEWFPCFNIGGSFLNYTCHWFTRWRHNSWLEAKLPPTKSPLATDNGGLFAADHSFHHWIMISRGAYRGFFFGAAPWKWRILTGSMLHVFLATIVRN
jgi:hypothetical protein